MSSSTSSPNRNEDVKMNEDIAASRVLGIFGMSIFTRRGDLEKLFEEFGPIEKVEVIHNRQTGRSKGFGFVYFERQEDAEIARHKTNGLELNERKIRVDFSKTEAPHNPTPGFYNGKPIEEVRRERDDRGRSHSGRNYRDSNDSDRHYVPRRRSRSRSRDNGPPAYRRRDDRDRDYRRDDRDYRRDDRDREYRRDDRDREYRRDDRPIRRSPSPRRN